MSDSLPTGNISLTRHDQSRGAVYSSDTSVAAWNFAQVLLPLFLTNEPAKDTGAKANLVFTGATMAVRGASNFGHMSAGMFGRRAISQSLAKEFGPQGIHVSHVIVDGLIDVGYMKEKFPEDADKVSMADVEEYTSD